MAVSCLFSRFSLLCSAWLLLMGFSCSLVYAQSTDRSNPVAVQGGVVQGDVETVGQSHYYTFEAGPGDLKLVMEGQTDFNTTNTHLLLTDDSGRELATTTFSAGGNGTTRSTVIKLLRRQTIRMQLLFGADVGVHLKYKVTLAGAREEGRLASVAVVAPVARPMAATTSAAEPLNKSAAAQEVSLSTDETGSRNVRAAPIEDKWAFVVGVSKFAKPGIDLKYSAKDARDLAGYLVKEANFAPDHVKLLVDEQATKERVLAELGDKWLPRLAHPNDLVLIFISTHGSPSQADLEGLNYLVMHNTDPGSLYATGLPLSDLAAAVKHRVHSSRVVLIIDACHSGAADTAKGLGRVGNVDSTSLAQGTGQLIICSSQPNQVSWESKRYPNGVFTHQLIEALRGESGKITLSQAFEKLKESVQSEVLQDRSELQTAVLKSKWSGNDLIISAPPAKPRPLPADFIEGR
ncbi:MAG: caspase family protein [Candidatus Melainabacteria bacterium]|nr:caspase family protein [Candidatus Melainabacteria bacterium]